MSQARKSSVGSPKSYAGKDNWEKRLGNVHLYENTHGSNWTR